VRKVKRQKMNKEFSPAQLNQRDTERLRHYKELLDFYQGKQWPGRATRGEKQLTFNYARVVVDKVSSYLMSGVHFIIEAAEDSDEARAKSQRAEVALQRVVQENNLEQLDLETEVDCAILGDACFKVIWDAEAKSVRVTTPDIQGIYAWWLGDDTSRVWRVASKYSLSAEEAELLHQVRPKSKTATIVELWTEYSFELWPDDTLLEKKANPYGFIPFVIYPNLRETKKFWGVSDLVQLMEPQKELNRALSQLSRILELSGNPIAVLENVEQSEDIAVTPGAVWNIPEEAKAYLLDLLQGGGVRLHIDYIDLLYRTLHDVAESPRAAFGGTAGDLSGVALEIELQPLLQKIWRKRLIRTAALRQRSRLILRLLEKYQNQDFGNYRVDVVWSPVLPRDLSHLVESEQTLVQNGIHSRRRAMSEIGVKEPEVEFTRWLEERTAILRMNQELNTRPRGVRREGQPQTEGIEQ
jgi:hypothetical protein